MEIPFSLLAENFNSTKTNKKENAAAFSFFSIKMVENYILFVFIFLAKSVKTSKIT